MLGSFVLPGGVVELGIFGRVPGFVGSVDGVPMLGSIVCLGGFPMLGFVGGELIAGSDGVSTVGSLGFVLLEPLVLVFFRIAVGFAFFFFLRLIFAATFTFEVEANVCRAELDSI